MEVVKGQEPVQGEQQTNQAGELNVTLNKKKAPIILVVGVSKVGKQFLVEALVNIISLSGYSVNATPLKELEGKEVEEDFHVISEEDFDQDIENKVTLVFACFRNPEGLKTELKELLLLNSAEWETICYNFYELTKWMRSSKLAYTLNMDHESNAKGLHNYNTLRNMILPMNFAFQTMIIKDNPVRFDKVSPQALIESLMPELKDKSKEAEKKFDKEVVKSKEEKEEENNGQI